MVLVHQKKIDEALQYFQKAISLEPQFANAHYQAAIILKQKGSITEADYHFREAVRINPEFKKKRNVLPTE
jgi:tetratricopeptide (TPR) repeat protein